MDLNCSRMGDIFSQLAKLEMMLNCWLDLKDFYVAVVRRFNDSVFQVADGQIILYKLKLFFSAVSFSFCSGHSDIRSS